MKAIDVLAGMAKALLAGLTAGVGAIATAAIDDKITPGEWWAGAAAALVALGLVYGVPNKTAVYDARHDRP